MFRRRHVPLLYLHYDVHLYVYTGVYIDYHILLIKLY